MAPDRTMLHLVKQISQTPPPPPLQNYGVHTIKPQLRPWYAMLDLLNEAIFYCMVCCIRFCTVNRLRHINVYWHNYLVNSI